MKFMPVCAVAAALAATACNSASSRDEERAAAAVAHARNAADLAAAEVAQAMPASLMGIRQFSVQDQQGGQAGVFRGTGGAGWIGPDLVNGGEIAWTEVFRRDDQMILEARGDWDTYEVSVQLSGRIYVAYKPAGAEFRDVEDYRAVNVIAE